MNIWFSSILGLKFQCIKKFSEFLLFKIVIIATPNNLLRDKKFSSKSKEFCRKNQKNAGTSVVRPDIDRIKSNRAFCCAVLYIFFSVIKPLFFLLQAFFLKRISKTKQWERNFPLRSPFNTNRITIYRSRNPAKKRSRLQGKGGVYNRL